MSLNLNSCDQVFPAIKDIKMALGNYPNLPSNYTGTAIIDKWANVFEGKKASDELEEEEIRQLKFDLENVMNEFNEVVLKAK